VNLLAGGAILAASQGKGKFQRGNARARDADTASPVRLYYFPMSASAAPGQAPPEEQLSLRAVRPPDLLGTARQWPRTGLWSDLLVLLRGPAAPRGWPVGPFFPDAWLRGGANWELMCLSAVFHVLLIIFPFRMWHLIHQANETPQQNMEVTWTSSSRALLPYIPALRKDVRKAALRGEDAAKKTPHAFDPQQTIVSRPKIATHPRQTLIEPNAPPEPPKILTPLPDIVEWPNLARPAPRRHIRLNPNARMRQRRVAPRPRVAAPDVPAAPTAPEITFSSAHPDLPKPALEVKTDARPTFATPKAAEEPAPEVAATINPDAPGQRLVALSENPAPPPPELQVPAGNLTADFVKSPDGTPEGGAGSAANIRAGSSRGAAIPGVAIVGGKRGPTSNIAGPPGAPGMNGVGSGGALPLPRATLGLSRQPAPPAAPGQSSRVMPSSIQDRIKAAQKPEDLLDPGHIYTVRVNMPNLASVTGTWVLKFVELDENGKEIPDSLDLPSVAGPVALRKVDPKYPPEYVHQRVQGDVVLYAIIRRDGSVDSIEVVKSLDPQLDHNAMEAFARWKFQAAQREGRNVELAAIVRIPFRAVSALF